MLDARARARILLPVALIGCQDAPSGPRPTTPLTLCAYEWMAYRNDGGEWTRALAGADGRVHIDATPRIAIATGSWMNVPNVTPQLGVSFLTAEQARVTYSHGCRAIEPGPPGRVAGVVRGIEADGWASVHHAGFNAGGSIRASRPEFTLVAWDGEHDLIATRFPPQSLVPDHPDRMIIRRAQRLAGGSSVTLDFASDESFALVPHTLSWNGPTVGAQLNFQTTEASGVGNDVFLQSTRSGAPPGPDGPNTITLYAVPAARLVAGDMHRMSTGDGRRSIDFYYHAGRDRTIAWGPPASQPRFVTVGTSPSVRLRMEVPSQPEYGALIMATLSQYALTNGFIGATNQVSMLATREYFGGTPRTWTLEMPDLTRVPGFQDVFGLHPRAYEWNVVVTSRPYWFKQSDATDGLVIRSASDHGEATAP